MNKLIIVACLAGCVQDGLVDEPTTAEECCLLYPVEHDIRECFARFVPDGTCKALACPAFGYETSWICNDADEPDGPVPP